MAQGGIPTWNQPYPQNGPPPTFGNSHFNPTQGYIEPNISHPYNSVAPYLDVMPGNIAPAHPSLAQNISNQPTGTPTVVAQPAVTQPVLTQPVAAQPAATQPVNGQVASTEPTNNQPANTQPVNPPAGPVSLPHAGPADPSHGVQSHGVFMRRKNVYLPNLKGAKFLWTKRRANADLIQRALQEYAASDNVKTAATKNYAEAAFEQLSKADQDHWHTIARLVKRIEESFILVTPQSVSSYVFVCGSH